MTHAGCKLDTYGQGNASSESGTVSTDAEPTGGENPILRAFRIDTLKLIDPHLFIDPCYDYTNMVNMAFEKQITEDIYTLVLHIDFGDEAMLTAELKEATSCDLDQGTCVDASNVDPKVPLLLRKESGTCVMLDTSTIAAPDQPMLNMPQSPCAHSQSSTLTVPLEGSTPIVLHEAQVAFNFDSESDPTQITNGLLYGFWPQSFAEETFFNGVAIWSNIVAVGCEDPKFLPSVDTLTEDTGPIDGVWMAFNFTATRVEILKE